MSTPTKPAILEFLAGRPLGATGAEVAQHIDSPIRSVGQTLARLADRGEIYQITDGTREESVWALTPRDDTPPIYSAMQTLEAMRSVAHRVFAEHAVSQLRSRDTEKCTA